MHHYQCLYSEQQTLFPHHTCFERPFLQSKLRWFEKIVTGNISVGSDRSDNACTFEIEVKSDF
jgi:hypothetical protein